MRTTRAQQVVTLRERYEEMAQANEQEAYRAIGQAQALTWVVGQLSLLTAEAKPARVQALVEDLLASLSEQKASRLIVCIREKRRHSVTVAGEWMAQGAIGQIDEIAQELCARLTPQWNATSPKRHGLSFQVYHRADLSTDIETGKQCWRSAEREQWYQEVAIVKARSAESALEEVLRLTCGSRWPDYPGVVWSRLQPPPLRPTAAGDIIVSLLSGAAWMVGQTGFQAIGATAPEEGEAGPPR